MPSRLMKATKAELRTSERAFQKDLDRALGKTSKTADKEADKRARAGRTWRDFFWG